MVPDSPISATPDSRIGGRVDAIGNSPDRDDGDYLSDYRQRYGLSVDPFGNDPDFPLFTGAQRRELLDQLLHLCQFGNSLLVILGERGVGKTRVAHALLDLMADTDEACLVTAQANQKLDDILIHIAQAFGLRREGAESVGQLLAALRGFSQPIMGGGELALVVIDNAHHLDDQTLAALLSLLQGREEDNRRLHLVFFAEPSLIGRLDQLDMQGVMINDFYLERFNLAETVDYLNFRMEMSDYLGSEIFNESLVEPWWREAGGQLPLIHEHARTCLLEAVTPEFNTPKKAFPVLHIVAAAVLGAVFLMTFLYGGDDKEEPADRIFSQAIPITPISAASESSLSNTGASLAAPIAQNNVIQSSSVPVQPALDPLSPTQLPPVQESVSAPVETNVPEVIEQPSQPVAVPVIVEQEKKPTTPARSAALSEDEQILLSWRASEFTLQLLGVSTEKAARDYIAGQSNRSDLLMFKSRRQGKDWFVVVSGRFPSAASARSAVAGLPADQRKAGPWPRELKVIQQEIGVAHGL